MDKLSHYRDLIKQSLTRIADLLNRRPATGVESLLAFDDERGQYLLIKSGWAGDRRVRGITLHVRLQDGKIRVEEDWTEDGIATELVNQGVPREDIVLAFHPPAVRPLTEFAPA